MKSLPWIRDVFDAYQLNIQFFWILGSFLNLLIPQQAFSQSVSYQYYDINKIHANEVIKGISKDEQGFIWLATDQGVLQFDGNETTLFYKELPSPFTKKFLNRKNGQLLVLSDFGIREIVHHIDTTYFQPLQVAGKPFTEGLNYPKSVFEDSQGNLWIGELNAVVKISENGFQRYLLGAEYRSINYHRAFSFAEDAFGHIWVAPYNGRLLSYNEAEDRLEDVAIAYPLTDVTTIFSMQGDDLYLGGKEGMLKLRVNSDKEVLEHAFIGGPENISTAIPIDDQIYIGTWNEGLFHSHANALPLQFTKVEALSFDDILDFHYDEPQKELWITGSENIGLLKPSLISAVSSVGKTRVEALTAGNDGKLYYSTGQEINMIDLDQPGKSRQIVSSQSTYFDRILAADDKLWIGYAFGGIAYYDMVRREMHSVIDTTISGNAVKFIHQDQEGNTWFSGLSEALIRIDAAGNIKRYPAVNRSVVIKASENGTLYCGAQGKESLLYLYDPEQDTFNPLSLTYDFTPTDDILVEDIAFDSLNNLWLASTEGLIKVTQQNNAYHAHRMPLKGVDENEPVSAIAITGHRIWLAYSHALAVYDQQEMIFFTRESGLPSRLLKERGFLKHDTGLYIATAKGLAKIDVRNFDYSPTPQPIFKSILVNGEPLDFSEGQDITLPYESRIQVEYVSLSYPGNNMLYQTRLTGLEDQWTAPSPSSSMSVLGFTEGSYKLLVRARDTGYSWSKPLALQFVILAPWYKSWWGILLLIATGIALILVSIKIYHFQLIRQKRKLQCLVEARTKEISRQKNEIIEQKNIFIQQKEELIEKNNAVFNSQKALAEADLNFLHLKEKQLQDQIEYRNKQITTHTLNIIQKNEMLRELREQLEHIIKSQSGSASAELKKLLKIIDESFRLDKDWEEFKLYFEQIYTGFYAKLKISHPDLTNQELRHCALIRLNLSNHECASILGISPNSIKVTRTRLRKKLDLPGHQNLTDFIMGI